MTKKSERFPDALEQLHDELRKSERKILAEIAPSGRLFFIAIVVVLLLADILVIPFASAHGAYVLGREIIAGTVNPDVGAVSNIGRVFLFVVVLDIVLTILALVLRRWGVAFAAAAVSCVGSALGILSVWHSQTSQGKFASVHWGQLFSVVLMWALAVSWVRLTTNNIEQ